MFIRESKSTLKDGTAVTYLQLVESVWNRSKRSPRHRVVHSFGRKDKLDVAQIERLVASLRKYLDPELAGDVEFRRFIDAKQMGVTYLLDALWQKLKVDRFFRRALADRQFETPIERAIFAMVAQRAYATGGKVKCEHWVSKLGYIRGLPEVQVHQLYRAMDFLLAHGRELEDELYFQVNDLLDLNLSVVFYDTTAMYLEIDEPDGEGGVALHAHRHAPFHLDWHRIG